MKKLGLEKGPWGPRDGEDTRKKPSSSEENNPWAQKWKTPFGEAPKGFQDFFKSNSKNGKGKGGDLPPFLKEKKSILLIFLGIFVLWMLTGFYRVQPDEVGIVLRFGKWVRTSQAGLNYHLPSPIETVLLPSVTRINRIDLGFRSGKDGISSQIPEESLMLTGDENIVDINFTVFWLIKDAGDFLFKIRSPNATVKAASESTMREVIGQTPIAESMAEGRRQIEEKVKTLLQDLMNEYQAGIEITEVQLQRVDPPAEVIDAFRDVQRARADLERLRNDAEAYRNKIIPEARGDAESIIQEAAGYKQQVIQAAEGEANRFNSVLSAYKTAPEITATRMSLETMEEIFSNANKVIMDGSQVKGGNILPYLPLDGLKPKDIKTPDVSSQGDEQ